MDAFDREVEVLIAHDKHEKDLRSLVELAGIRIIKTYRLENQYWPNYPKYWHLRTPWLLVATPHGMIQVGHRKRVFVIDWADTPLRKVITEDDVTKNETVVHAWTQSKALEYLTALGKLLTSKESVDEQVAATC